MTSGRAIAALLLLALCGCGGRAIEFNNQVAAVHSRLGPAAEQFGRVLREAVDRGAPPTAEEFAAAAERFRGELAAAEERSAQLRVPSLPQADELYAAHQAFLAWERTKLEEELARIEQLLGEPTLNAQSAYAGLAARFVALRAQEERQLQTLHAAQRRFAEANGLKLIHVTETD